MTFSLLNKASENLRAAELLLANDLSEIAASRVYYAMFYIAETLLAQQGQKFSSHSAVIAAYGKAFAKTQQLDPKFHRYLIDAQDLRQVGDYGFEGTVTPT